MCLFPKTEESMLQKILDGKVKISNIDLSFPDNFSVAKTALQQKPKLATDLDVKKAWEKKLVIAWLEDTVNRNALGVKLSYLGLEKVFSETAHDDIIKTYLRLILNMGTVASDFSTFQSFQNEVVMKLNYETNAGEEIVYRDKELDLPLYLSTKTDVTFKVVDAYEFIKFIDVHVEQISQQQIVSKFIPIIVNAMRSAMHKVIAEKDIVYFELGKYYEDISIAFENALKDVFAGHGIEVVGSYLHSIKTSNEAEKIFERQRIRFMQIEKNMDLTHKAELLSLENYEKKAEIHKKYPEFELGLTEKEKDNAIDRYLLKVTGQKDEQFEEAFDTQLKERNTDVGKVSKVKNIFEEKIDFKKVKKSSILKAVGIVLAIILFISGLSNMMYTSISSGIMMMLIAAVIFIVVIASVVKAKKTGDKDNNTAAAPMPTNNETSEAPKGQE